MKSFKIAVCALSCLAVVATAQAAVNPHKWYWDGNIGYMVTDNTEIGYVSVPFIGLTDSRHTDSPVGLGSNIGYQFNSYFAVELGFIYSFATLKSTEDGFIPVGPGVDVTVQQKIYDQFATHFSLKGSVPLFLPHLQAFGKVGVAYTRASSTAELKVNVDGIGTVVDARSQRRSVDSFAPAVGLGLEYAVGDDYYLQLGWAFIPGKEVRAVACNPAATNPVCPFTHNIPAINEVYAGFGIRFK